jgi:Subtilase family
MIVDIELSTPPELILIVDPKAGIRVRDGEVISIVDGVNVAPLRELLHSVEAAIRPLYGASEDWLKYRTSYLNIMMGRDQVLDLSIFYKINGPKGVLRLLPAALRQIPFVQAAYLKPLASLPVVEEREELFTEENILIGNSDDFTPEQEYLDSAADGGIDARYAWDVPGGRGTDIKIIDVEGAWCFSHEDLVENPSGCIVGVPIASADWRKHGTAVLGMLGADHNQFGVAGICPDADVRCASIFESTTADPTQDGGSAAAIRAAADFLPAGSIMLLELHRPGPVVNFRANQDQMGYIPVEWWPCDMAAILYATSRDIIVIAAAGNGDQNLCDEIYSQNPPTDPGPFPNWWVNPFKRDPVDTKAILVGAGLPPWGIHGSRFGPERSRFRRSNFGANVDTQAWGAEVATCGFNGDLTPHAPEVRRYTRRFNGTSSASAMIAGAVCCLQGVLKFQQRRLSPLESRTLLSDSGLGLPQQDGPLGPAQLQPIGPRPDLKRLIESL